MIFSEISIKSAIRSAAAKRWTVRTAYESALQEIRAIESGDSRVTRTTPSGIVHVRYTTTNGWAFVVFNDAGDFDYIEHATLYEGTLHSVRVESFPTVLGHPYLYPRAHREASCDGCYVCLFSSYRPRDLTKWDWPIR
jgi:hypothetical protein